MVKYCDETLAFQPYHSILHQYQIIVTISKLISGVSMAIIFRKFDL